MKYLVFAMSLIFSFPSYADCFQWPLRYGYGQRLAYDADTIYINLPGLPDGLTKMSVRVNGVDTPEIKGKCPSEKENAIRAREYVLQLLDNSQEVVFCDPQWGKYAGRLVANTFIDGQNLASLLIRNGMGRPYQGGKRTGWCD